MVSFEIVDGDDIDYEMFASLQREAYKELLSNLKVSNNFMTPMFYRWKFHPPAGTAKIAIVKKGERLISTNAMIPVKLQMGKYKIQGWQATDAATLKTERRKGYSSRCLQLFTQILKTNEIIFVFPNKSSAPYAEKLGFHSKGVITTWVKPAILLNKKVSENVIRVTKFGKEQDVLAEKLVDTNKVIISRVADYLNWRYVDHPIYKYTLFVYRDAKEQQGYGVVRKLEAIGHTIAVVMELWGLQPKIKIELLRSITAWAIEQGIKKIVLQENSQSLLSGLKAGFIAVPHWILPKKQLSLIHI